MSYFHKAWLFRGLLSTWIFCLDCWNAKHSILRLNATPFSPVLLLKDTPKHFEISEKIRSQKEKNWRSGNIPCKSLWEEGRYQRDWTMFWMTPCLKLWSIRLEHACHPTCSKQFCELTQLSLYIYKYIILVVKMQKMRKIKKNSIFSSLGNQKSGSNKVILQNGPSFPKNFKLDLVPFLQNNSYNPGLNKFIQILGFHLTKILNLYIIPILQNNSGRRRSYWFFCTSCRYFVVIWNRKQLNF